REGQQPSRRRAAAPSQRKTVPTPDIGRQHSSAPRTARGSARLPSAPGHGADVAPRVHGAPSWTWLWRAAGKRKRPYSLGARGWQRGSPPLEGIYMPFRTCRTTLLLLLTLLMAVGASAAEPEAPLPLKRVAGNAAQPAFMGPDLQITMTDGVTTVT